MRHRIIPGLIGGCDQLSTEGLLDRWWDRRRGAALPAGWVVRWDRVRAIRAAISSGCYDLDGRVLDLLDVLPGD